MKLLIVEDEQDLRDVIGFYLESELGAEVSYASSVAEAKQVFSEPGLFSAVVCDFALGDGTAEDVYRYLLSKNSEVPFILCGVYHPDTYPIFKENKIHGFVMKSEIFEKLKGTLNSVLANMPAPLKSGGKSEYCRIRTETILKLGLLGCDLFLQLPHDRFVRVLREGDLFEAEDLKRFDDKSVKYLYVQAKDRDGLLEKMTRDLLQLASLKSSAKSSEKSSARKSVFDASTSALEVVAELTQRFGFTPAVQRLTDANVSLVVANIQKNEMLADLFSKLMVDPDSYIASHSVALAYLNCGIASLMGWKSDMTFYKLTLASFLHDILVESEELAEIQTLSTLNARAEEFTPEQVRDYLKHPQLCADLLRKMKDIPIDVDFIILQHHERPDGTGFPGHLNHLKISPLAAVFVLAHELLEFHYKTRDPQDSAEVVNFLNGLPDEYSQGYFKNLMKALVDSVSSLAKG
jgi:HD-GYP domain-containing protein (c-di-GMP phosphodiesterase class II)